MGKESGEKITGIRTWGWDKEVVGISVLEAKWSSVIVSITYESNFK